MIIVIRLVPATLTLLDAALAGTDALALALGHDVVPGWASFPDALRATRDAAVASTAPPSWGARFFVVEEPPQLIGWGGFKGPPRDGTVEIGYEIAPGWRGRGAATAPARAMVAEAFADEHVTAVIAHTLPEPNASNHVPEKVGFRYDGPHHDQGERVWRYRVTR